MAGGDLDPGEGIAQGADEPDEEKGGGGKDQLDGVECVVVIDHIVEDFGRRRVRVGRLGRDCEADYHDEDEQDPVVAP